MPATTTTKNEVSRVSLWVGLFGGAMAWAIHFLSAYVVAEFGCVGGLGVRSYWDISLVAWLELVLTFAAILIAAASTVVAYRSRLRLSSDTVGACATQQAERYTAHAGLLTSGIFTFVIVFESIPIFFYLRSC